MALIYRFTKIGLNEKLVHQLPNALFNAMKLLKKLNTPTVQLLKVLLVLSVNMLIFPWHTAIDVTLTKHSLIITQAVPPLIWHSINIFNAALVVDSSIAVIATY